MELINEFTVNASIEKTWATLTDLELIAPCMPGAQLTEIEGENYRGHVKVKVGPISAQFKGQAHFVERDDVNHKAVLKGEGRDTGGKGNASALITAQLTSVDETTTKCVVTTDLTITGKVAQFGRGAMADVSDKLLKQFVTNLETQVLSQDAAASVADEPAAEELAPPVGPATDVPPTAAPEEPKVRKIESKPAEPIDLLETAGGSYAQAPCPDRGRASAHPPAPSPPQGLSASSRSAMDDRDQVTQLLGRPPVADFDVVVRDRTGAPVVIRNAPLLPDGTPMPTRYWLVGRELHTAVGQLESDGGVNRAEAEIGLELIAEAHTRYAAERDAALPAGHLGPRPSGGVAGTRIGVKCLHAHYAWFLAGGDDPVGAWVQARFDAIAATGADADQEGADA